MTNKPTVLIATLPEMVDLLKEHFGPRFNLIIVTEMQPALAALDKQLDFILCNIHFAEGLLYDFLRTVKVHPKSRDVPFIVIDGSMEGFTPSIRQSIEIATKALGADQFIEFAKWRHELGNAGAFDKFISTVACHLSKE